MKSALKMNPQEKRASLSLASIFALRMLGMFIILPVFSLYAAHLPGGDDKTLVGLALGAYGLTQAVLQIPLGWVSDRIGRKTVIAGGLVVFAVGSFVAASATNIEGVILGRVIQGSGAISAAVIALTADLTRAEVRTKAMALIGVTIGITFSISMVLAPALYPIIGVPGLFMLTGVLALLAIGVVYGLVPKAPEQAMDRPDISAFKKVLTNLELLRLNAGIFVLHATLMAIFVVVPSWLVVGGLPQDDHWKLYLPVMLVSFVLMIPGVAMSHGKRRKGIYLFSVATLMVSQLLLQVFAGQVWPMAFALTVFFIAFNTLEACLPSFLTLACPPELKGTASGIFSSLQFLGAFCGAILAGLTSKFLGPQWVPLICILLSLAWLVLAWPMRLTQSPS